MTQMTITMTPRFLKRVPEPTRSALRVAVIIVASWDKELFSHSEQVARHLVRFAPPNSQEEWYWAGLLHDIGKVGVPAHVLSKPGALTPNEWSAIRQHPLRGAAILKKMNVPSVIVQAAKFHHERWDGTGYPYDIRGRQIPLIARALSVADVYAALTSDRVYRAAFTRRQARQEIERHAGTQFDPEIVAQFFQERFHAKKNLSFVR